MNTQLKLGLTLLFGIALGAVGVQALQAEQDEGAKTFKAGDTIHVTRETVHGGKVTGDAPLKLLAVHIVDKGKPLADPVK